MIHVAAMTFAYDRQAPAFREFTVRVGRGDIWAVIGASGCGKTTLLYLLAGLLFPTAGTIRVDGRPITRPRPQTGLVLQDHGLLPWATVADNVRLGFKIRKFYGADGRHAPADSPVDQRTADETVSRWLERLGIDHLHKQFPAKLSRGQRQRTAIARTMVLAPDLLLLDEPFSALDAPTREDLQHLVVELQRETGMTCIIVTHDIEEAAAMGEKILVLTGAANQGAEIIENACTLNTGNRGREDFQPMCEALRRKLGKLT